jgi:hypothetical protein
MRRLVICGLLFCGSAVFAQTDSSQQLPGQVQKQLPGQTQPQAPQQLPEQLKQLAPTQPTGEKCGQITGQADVTVEKTQDGAILRMKAKDPGQVAQVQEAAQKLQTCLSSPAGEPAK